MNGVLEIIGATTVFLGGGYLFCAAVALVTMHVTRKHEIGALVYGAMASKIAAVVWIGLFFWFGPITLSVGVSP